MNMKKEKSATGVWSALKAQQVESRRDQSGYWNSCSDGDGEIPEGGHSALQSCRLMYDAATLVSMCLVCFQLHSGIPTPSSDEHLASWSVALGRHFGSLRQALRLQIPVFHWQLGIVVASSQGRFKCV